LSLAESGVKNLLEIGTGELTPRIGGHNLYILFSLHEGFPAPTAHSPVFFTGRTAEDDDRRVSNPNATTHVFSSPRTLDEVHTVAADHHKIVSLMRAIFPYRAQNLLAQNHRFLAQSPAGWDTLSST
jgi:hypothetical protein